MADVLVVIEHRDGEIREVSFQMLHKADELCRARSCNLVAVVLGESNAALVASIVDKADKVVSIESEAFRHFDVAVAKGVLSDLIRKEAPFLTLIGHTPWGMDLAPALSVRLGLPLSSDVVNILLEEGRPKVIRQIYNGKLFARVSMRESCGYLVTVRPGAFPAEGQGKRSAEVVSGLVPELPESGKRFIALEESVAGELDITQADLLISIGRGIGDPENIPQVSKLAEDLGGALSCSRPVVDKNWLPKHHQVGTSGKSVKPKVYLALGISGAFQHLAGITGAGTVIAVNKDPMAPILREADYGVVADMMKVVEAMKENLMQKPLG